MKNFKLFQSILLISSFFLFINCSSDDDTTVVTPQPIPSDFTITSNNISNVEFTIEWTAATVEGAEGVMYDVFLDEVEVASNLDVLTYTFSDLDAETVYNVEVIAISNEFETTSTQVIEVATLNLPTPSEFALTSTDIAISEFTIDWTAAIVEGDEGVVYDVFLDDTLVESDLDVLTYTFSNLDAETLYGVEITAKSNEFGTTSTQRLDVMTLNGPTPSEFVITSRDIEISEFTIEWTASTVDGDEGVIYDVLLNDELVASDLNMLTYMFSDLDPETIYNVEVIAKSNEFGTSSTQMINVTTESAPSPDDFTLTLNSVGTGSANISWSSLTIDGEGGVLADIFIDNNEEATGVTSSSWTFTGLTPNTIHTVRIVARSSEYGTTTENEITFTTESVPTTFEVTSAVVNPRTTGTFGGPPSIIIRFTNRDLLDGITLNGITYMSYAFAGSDGIVISLSDDEYDDLSNAMVKEGSAAFTENNVSSTTIFDYTVN